MAKNSLIIGIQLQRARELLKFTIENVAQELNVKVTDIVNWEREETRPNLNQLEKLANLYGRDIDYFLKDTPKPPKNIEFRGKPGKSLTDLSKETRLILANFDELCRTIYEFENLLKKKTKTKILKFKEEYTSIKAAQIIRNKINLIDAPLKSLRNILENAGFRIFELTIPNDEISGFSYWHNEYGPCILLNADDTIGRRNFTLAHELAHLLFSHGSSVCFIPSKIFKHLGSVEYKANRFAIELLLPERIISEEFEKRHISFRPTLVELRNLAYKWGVSNQALGYRFENLGLIEKGHTDTLIEPKKRIFRQPKVPKWERKLGKHYVTTSIEAYKKNIITMGKLAHALKLPVNKAVDEVSKRI